jgi:hypothetical protein
MQVAIVGPSKKRKDFNDPMNDQESEKPNKRSQKQEARKSAQEAELQGPSATPGGPPRLYAIADQVADDVLYYRNEYVKALETAFPYDKDMMYIDRYYPGAQGGPLYIDSPATRAEEEKCMKKAHVMLEANIRYAFILPGEFLEDVLKRIGDGLAQLSPRGA